MRPRQGIRLVTAALLSAFAWGGPSNVRAQSGSASTADAVGPKATRAKTTKKPTTADIGKLGVLSRFSTKLVGGEARSKNIRRIARMMDGVVVAPGRSFSVNHFMGARTEEKKFVLAPDEPELDPTEIMGGGLSQFSTTLYNALYDAGFPIFEHTPHRHHVSRYPSGVEVTLGWPGPDLVFKNDSAAPLVIKTSSSPERVVVKLLGSTPGRKVVRKRPVELERKPPPVEHVSDESLRSNQQVVERQGSPRRAVRVKRIVENPGARRRVDEEVVVYSASKRVVRAHPCRLPKGHKDAVKCSNNK